MDIEMLAPHSVEMIELKSIAILVSIYFLTKFSFIKKKLIKKINL